MTNKRMTRYCLLCEAVDCVLHIMDGDKSIYQGEITECYHCGEVLDKGEEIAELGGELLHYRCYGEFINYEEDSNSYL